MISENQKNTIISYLLPFRPSMIGLFGSHSRGQEKLSSDIDILIDFQESISLLQHIRIEQELSEIIGTKIDMVTKAAARNKFFRKRIDNDLKVIYEAP